MLGEGNCHPIEDMERAGHESVLRAAERLGFEICGPGQHEAVRSIVDGRDTLCVMSTGSGKSAIYQLAGFLIDGPTVVVSPLIALQQDQMEAIEEEAAVLNSTLTDSQRDEVFEDVADDEVEFLLLAPEQLANEEVFDGSPKPASPLRRRRGALRQPVGPRLPPRLPAARRRDRRSRPPAGPRADRHRRAARPRRHPPACSGWRTPR